MQRTLALGPLSPKAPEGAGRAPARPEPVPSKGAKGNVGALKGASIQIEQALKARRRRLAGCGFRRSLLHLI